MVRAMRGARTVSASSPLRPMPLALNAWRRISRLQTILAAGERVQTDRPDHTTARFMERAYRIYGQLDRDNHSALDLLAHRRLELPELERRMLDALLDGWFSVFEIERVKVDERLQVRDLFRNGPNGLLVYSMEEPEGMAC
jgi:hypothetical protein